MSIGLRVLGVVVVGCFGQMACGTEADAAQEVRTEPAEVSGESACNYDHPLMRYISKDPVECTLIDFLCAPDSRPFFNACGCGCKRRGNACDYNDPNRLYVAKDPDTCARIRFSCVEGTTPFSDECGCGCELTPSP